MADGEPDSEPDCEFVAMRAHPLYKDLSGQDEFDGQEADAALLARPRMRLRAEHRKQPEGRLSSREDASKKKCEEQPWVNARPRVREDARCWKNIIRDSDLLVSARSTQNPRNNKGSSSYCGEIYGK